MEEQRKSLFQRLGAEAVVTFTIAGAAVIITTVSFQQHTQDFEAVAQRDMTRLEERIASLEARERADTLILTRVDTHVEGLREDMTSLREQVATVLTRLPVTTKE